MLARIVNIVIGVWLMAAPSVMGISQKPAAALYILGPLITSVAIISISESVRNFRYLNVVFGYCLLATPVFFDYPSLVDFSNVLAGIVVIVSAYIKGKVKNRFEGGWRSLFGSRM